MRLYKFSSNSRYIKVWQVYDVDAVKKAGLLFCIVSDSRYLCNSVYYKKIKDRYKQWL